MARIPGTFEASYNFEPKIAGAFDARTLVPSYADLLSFTSDNYLVNGFTVAVYDADPNLRGIYQLIDKDNLSNPASWERIGAVGGTGTSGTSGTGASGTSGTSGTGAAADTSGSSPAPTSSPACRFPG